MPVMVSLSTGHLNKLSARPIVNTKHSVAPKLADIKLSLSTPGSLPAVHVQHVLDHCSLAASGQPPSVVCVCEVVLFQSDKGGGMLKPDSRAMERANGQTGPSGGTAAFQGWLV